MKDHAVIVRKYLEFWARLLEGSSISLIQAQTTSRHWVLKMKLIG